MNILKPEDVIKETVRFKTEILKLLVGLFAGSLGGTLAIARGDKSDSDLTVVVWGFTDYEVFVALGIIFSMVFLGASLWLGNQIHRTIQVKVKK